MRSDCIEGEMHQKLFGGREAHSTSTAQTTPPSPAAFMGGQGNGEGMAGGKDKEGDERMRRGQKKWQREKRMKEGRGSCPA